MLTLNDLEQIQELFQKEIFPLKQEIFFLKQRLELMDSKQSKATQKLNQKLDTAVKYFDTVTTTHQQRLRSLEKLQGIVVNDEE